MNNYLVLYIDIEYITGIVYTKNGTFYPIINSEQNLLWLYFYYDHKKNCVTNGKEFKKHFFSSEPNYFGNFFNQIVDKDAKVLINEVDKPFLDLLESAGILKLLTNNYKSIVSDNSDTIPVLLSFSTDVRQESRILLIEYLSSKGLKIVSAGIPICELICLHCWKQKEISPKDGSMVILLEATNSSLHIIKHNFFFRYFLCEDYSIETYPYKGIDPSMKAIINYVINTAGKTAPRLIGREEQAAEYDRLGPDAEEWLKLINGAEIKKPVKLPDILISGVTGEKLDIHIDRFSIEEQAESLITEIIEIFEAFENKTGEDQSKVSAVILFGNCFNNNRLKGRFARRLKANPLVVPIIELNKILSEYPQIDFIYYSDPEERRSIEKKGEIKKQYTRNLSIADDLFSRGEWDEAEDKYRLALSFKPGDQYCLCQIGKINEWRIKKPQEKIPQKLKQEDGEQADKNFPYKVAESADKSITDKNQQVVEIEIKPSRQASRIFPEEILDKVEELTKNEGEKNEQEIAMLEKDQKFEENIQKALELFLNGAFDEAERYCLLALAIKQKDEKCISLLEKIKNNQKDLREKQGKEEEYNEKISQAYDYYDRGELIEAAKYCLYALGIKQDDEKSLTLLEKIKNRQKEIEEKEEELKYNENIKKAYELFYGKKLTNAEEYCNLALRYRPNDQDCLLLLKSINQKKGTTRANRKKTAVMAGITLPILILIFFTIIHFSSNQSNIVNKIPQPGKDSIKGFVPKEIQGDGIANEEEPVEEAPGTKVSPPLETERGDNSKTQKKQGALDLESQLTFPNGNYYKGGVKEGKMHGYGTYVFVKAGKINSNGLEEVEPEVGDYIKGEWVEGDLYTGELFSKNNTSIRKLRHGKF
jgi:hypothetical protein